MYFVVSFPLCGPIQGTRVKGLTMRITTPWVLRHYTLLQGVGGFVRVKAVQNIRVVKILFELDPDSLL